MGKARCVFLKSTLRQPMRVALLLLMMTIMAFAFAVRLLECALILRETERAESFYRAVGDIEIISPDANLQGVTEYLEGNPYVELVEKQQLTSGVLPEGVYNADTGGYVYGPNRDVYYSGACQTDILFYGTIRSVEDQKSGYLLRTVVEEVVTGYPEYLAPGKELEITVTSGDAATAEGLVLGERYLLRATYNPDLCYDNGAMRKYLFVPLTEEGEPVLEASQDLDLEASEYRELAFEAQMVSENQRAMNVLAAFDMSALPSVQESVRTYYLREGRLLTAADTEKARQVCVIRDAFADLRGYGIGDTITLKLRNISSVVGYLTQEQDADSYDAVSTLEITLEIVGIVGMDEEASFYRNMVFVPASVIPVSFYTGSTGADTNYKAVATSFTLRDPEDTQAFLLDVKADLETMGVRVTMVENGWELFSPVADSMRDTARGNAILFGSILLLSVLLLAFLYFRFRRKEIAISRAFGVPVFWCVLYSSLPLVLIGGTGAVLGGGAGVCFAAARASELLSELAKLQEESIQTAVPLRWSILIIFGIFVLTTLAAAGFGFLTVRRSPLALLQGEKQHGYRRKQDRILTEESDPEKTPNTAAVRTVSRTRREFTPKLAPLWRSGRPSRGFTVKFVWRHVLRSPAKSFLVLLITAGFTVAIAAVQTALTKNEQKLNHLYQNIQVDGEIISAAVGSGISGEGFIYQETVDALLQTGFLADGYYEAAQLFQAAHRFDMETGSILFDGTIENIQVYGISDLDAFAAHRDPAPAVTYRQEDFVRPFETDGRTFKTDTGKILVSRMLYNSLNIQPGQYNIGLTVSGYTTVSLGVIGIIDLPGNVVVMPLDTMKWVVEDSLLYSRAEFTIAAEMIPRLEEFREVAGSITSRGSAGTVTLSLQIWDQQLQQAVTPLEDMLGFIRVLYPVAAAASALLCLGLTVLLVITSSKEAALLRMLGETKKQVRMKVALVALTPCLLGHLLGEGAGLVMTGAVLGVIFEPGMIAAILCIIICLVVEFLGAIIGALLTTRRNPLELLQVKE